MLSVLQVEPFASLAGDVGRSVPRLLINRDSVGPFSSESRRPNDVEQLGDVVSSVKTLVDALGWTQELDALMAPAAEGVSLLNTFIITLHTTVLWGYSLLNPMQVFNMYIQYINTFISTFTNDDVCVFICRLQRRLKSEKICPLGGLTLFTTVKITQ